MSDISTERRNNFDLLRFLLASTVLLFHVGVLSGSETLGRALRFASGRDAVLGFFAISGYVVSQSWMRVRSPGEYVRRRARRLLPGYVAVVLVCWIAGSIASSEPIARYWRDGQTWRYLASNLTFLQFLGPTLPGVFAKNPVLSAVNGSLWSIRTEIFCYAMVPLLAGSRWRSAALMMLCFAGLGSAPHWATTLTLAQVQIGVLEPVACFAVGAFCAAGNGSRLATYGDVLTLLLFSVTSYPARSVMEPLLIGCLVLAIALAPFYLGRWTMLGDLSYGIYLWHFPTVQWLSSQDWARRSPVAFLVIAICATLLLAACSWNLVEKRFLVRRKDSGKTVLPMHGKSHELPAGTMNGIKKALGLK